MIAFARRMTYVFVATVIVSMVFAVSGVMRNQKVRRDELRKQQVSEIMSAFESFILATGNARPFGLSEKQQHIGKAKDGCAIQNAQCQIDQQSCANLHFVTNNTKTSLPADILFGTRDRTFFAVQLLDPNTIQVRACGTEGEQEISVSKIFPKLGYVMNASGQEEFVYATPSAEAIKESLKDD